MVYTTTLLAAVTKCADHAPTYTLNGPIELYDVVTTDHAPVEWVVADGTQD